MQGVYGNKFTTVDEVVFIHNLDITDRGRYEFALVNHTLQDFAVILEGFSLEPMTASLEYVQKCAKSWHPNVPTRTVAVHHHNPTMSKEEAFDIILGRR